MTRLTSGTNYFHISFLLFFCVFSSYQVNAQSFSDMIRKAKEAKEALRSAKEAAKELSNTSKEVNNAYKSVRQTWKKDTSSNIQYQQVPDYRNKSEVSISKKQKISIENGQFKNLDWEPVTKFDNQIFPSFIMAWATYVGVKDEDMGSSLGFNINTNLKGVVLKWEIECADKTYFTTDSGYINCDDVKNTKAFLPKIAWNFRALSKHQTSAPLNVYFRLTDPNTGHKVEKLVNINLRSVNDCMMAYKNKDYKFLLAAFVTEEHPEVDRILKQMLDTKMIGAVDGYQSGSANVDLQLAALWRVLHDRGFKYSSITDNSAYEKGDGVFSQTVRTLDNSIKTSQANCVDGTVVFASVMKRMGLRPIMVLVPGHCFLAYFADGKTTTDIRFLETTLMSDRTYLSNPKASVLKNKAALAKIIPAGAKLSDLNKAYFLEYAGAKRVAEGEYNDYMKKYGAENVKLLNVNELRQYVQPIPLYQ